MLADFAIGDSAERGFTEFFTWAPRLIAAIAILIIGYFVAKAIGRVVWSALRRTGLDETMHGGPAGGFVQKVTTSPSRLLGRLAFWATWIGALVIAVSVLGIPALTAFIGAIFAYLPNVLAALLIFLVAGAISAGVAALVGRTMGDTPLGKIVATAAPILVMTIATFMILDQLKIAEDIVIITYAALIGAIALGSALAFGLGGREVAAQILRGTYEKGQENKEQFKQDLDKGMSRAKDEAQNMKEEMKGGGDSGGGQSGGRQSNGQGGETEVVFEPDTTIQPPR
jgi:hypothetical protein